MQAVSMAGHEPRRLGSLGWRERLEPRLRRLAAGWLGVPTEWFRPDLSLRDDLAMSARDVTELAIEMEQATGVRLSEDAVDAVDSYGDLVDRIVEARVAERPPTLPRLFVRASLTPARRDRRGVLLRSIWLTPYAVEMIVADARRAGPGARLDVVVPASAPLAVVEKVERCFREVAASGVTLRVQYDRLPHGRAVA